MQVLQLLAEGHTNKRIARELYISPRTAAVHVHRILAKPPGQFPGRSRRCRSPNRPSGAGADGEIVVAVPGLRAFRYA